MSTSTVPTNDQQRESAIINLSLLDVHHLPLTLNRPIGIVVGRTGSGKHHAAVVIADGLMASGGHLIRITDTYCGDDTIAEFVQKQLANNGVSPRIAMHFLPEAEAAPSLADSLAQINPPAGTLVLIDEPQRFRDFDSQTVMAVCARYNIGLLGIIQHIEAVATLDASMISFVVQAGQSVGDNFVVTHHGSEPNTAILDHVSLLAAMYRALN